MRFILVALMICLGSPAIADVDPGPVPTPNPPPEPPAPGPLLGLSEWCMDMSMIISGCHGKSPGASCGEGKICVGGNELYRYQTATTEYVLYDCRCENIVGPNPLEEDLEGTHSILEP